jgi:SAM-dependent methyltransferase
LFDAEKKMTDNILNMQTGRQIYVSEKVKITFGMIVLNGLPFIEYNLRALYPYAHQIIIVEGAAPSAKYVASIDGHSQDDTLAVLRRFQNEEDPEGKIIIVTAEDENYPDGFWPEKDEMSQAYAERATGNYIWQIDTDEFYLEEDMQQIIQLLAGDSEIKTISFSMHTFWGDAPYKVNGFFLEKFMVHRIFAWGDGYSYQTHRPVTIIDNQGRDLRTLKWMSPAAMRARNIYMYHYELLFPKQVKDKCSYYAGAQWTTALQKANDWVNNCYMAIGKPFRVHMMYNYISWLEKFNHKHPVQIYEMVKDVKAGQYPGIGLRDMKDADKLLLRPDYRLAAILLRSFIPLDRFLDAGKNFIKLTFVGRLVIKLKREFRGDLVHIDKKQVSQKLSDGWKSPSIPVLQRQLTESELADMYAGKVIRPYRVLAECIKIIGGENKSMIEVGCSTGYYSEVLSHLLGKRVNYTGVDYSAAMIEEAVKKYPDAKFREADATAMPYEYKTFDIVISGCCLLHIPNYEKAISESARIAKDWVIFHRTPIVQGPTAYYKKKAYGVPCVEIHFNEKNFIEMCNANGLELKETFDIAKGDEFSQCTYIFEKQQQVN